MSGGIAQSEDRIDSVINLSRAFGFYEYKSQPDTPPEQQAISCTPDTVIRSLPPGAAVFVGSAGLCSVIGTDHIERQIAEQAGGSAAAACRNVVDFAHQQSAQANKVGVYIRTAPPGGFAQMLSGDLLEVGLVDEDQDGVFTLAEGDAGGGSGSLTPRAPATVPRQK